MKGNKNFTDDKEDFKPGSMFGNIDKAPKIFRSDDAEKTYLGEPAYNQLGFKTKRQKKREKNGGINVGKDWEFNNIGGETADWAEYLARDAQQAAQNRRRGDED